MPWIIPAILEMEGSLEPHSEYSEPQRGQLVMFGVLDRVHAVCCPVFSPPRFPIIVYVWFGLVWTLCATHGSMQGLPLALRPGITPGSISANYQTWVSFMQDKCLNFCFSYLLTSIFISDFLLKHHNYQALRVGF